jgi:hypothetical protein
MLAQFIAGVILRFRNQPSEPLPTHSPNLLPDRWFRRLTINAGWLAPFTYAETVPPRITSLSFTHDSPSGAGVIDDS